MLLKNKEPYLNDEDKIVSLAKYVKDFDDVNKAVPIYVSSSIGFINYDLIEGKQFVEKLDTDMWHRYKVYTLGESKKALIENKLSVGELFCYSMYDIKDIFPDLLKLKTCQEVIDYLRDYNEEKDSTLIWNFMDKEEVSKIDAVAKINKKRNN